MAAQDERRQSIRLARGESRLLRVRAGTRLIGVAGCTMLAEPPGRLDGIDARIEIRLRAGEAHRIERAGWVVLTTDAGAGHAELACLPPASRAPRLAAAAGSAVAFIARRLRPWHKVCLSAWHRTPMRPPWTPSNTSPSSTARSSS